MKTLTVKRKHVLDALRYNHLVAGSWFHTDSDVISALKILGQDIESAVYLPNCTACLVGSTIRRASEEQFKNKPLRQRQMERSIEKSTDGRLYEKLLEKNDFDISPDKPNFSLAAKIAEKGFYFAALSHVFEGTIRQKAVKKALARGNEAWDYDEFTPKIKLSTKEKEKLSLWVKKNIPASFEVKL